MQWFLNDASLQGQFTSLQELQRTVGELIEAHKHQVRPHSFYVSRSLGERLALQAQSFAHAIQSLPDRDLRTKILIWINRRGPFIEDAPVQQDDNLFFYNGTDLDLTETGLGEASRRLLLGQQVGAWSFLGGNIDFGLSPLLLVHGLLEQPLGRLEIPNVWTLNDFRALVADSLAMPSSWSELATYIRHRFSSLHICDSFDRNAAIVSEPFESSIAARAIELCNHLNAYMESRNVDGSPSDRSQAMIRALFTGGTGSSALFSNESSQNLSTFRSEMEFPDPNNLAQNIFAPWHGKIRHRHFRMHFQWPVDKAARKLNVFYLGPKMTRR